MYSQQKKTTVASVTRDMDTHREKNSTLKLSGMWASQYEADKDTLDTVRKRARKMTQGLEHLS